MGIGDWGLGIGKMGKCGECGECGGKDFFPILPHLPPLPHFLLALYPYTLKTPIPLESLIKS
ncbi:hypothetical protein CLI64_19105 [Nostoc sp. CENA543]|nr:hypothetical protein CLI64_19105 [Nostoc sp. CENA543]